MKNVLKATALLGCLTAGIGVYSAFGNSGVVFNNSAAPVYIHKGPVQTLFGWNNAAFQACMNYSDANGLTCLRFEYIQDAGLNWRCIKSGQNNTTVQLRGGTLSLITTNTVLNTRPNGNATQILGFLLSSPQEAASASTGDAPFTCPAGTGWAVVQHCNSIFTGGNPNNANNYSYAGTGCNNNHPEGASWGDLGTATITVRDARPGGATFEIPAVPIID